jgi:uncharacterized metal-binding protein YceD (DUF177 family)
MLKISILGMEDGDHAFHSSCDSSLIQDMFPEFNGEVEIAGMIKKQGKRLTLNAIASCMSTLTCDISGEDFEQKIEAPINKHYRLDTQLFDLLKDKDDGDEIILRDDEDFIDITEEVRQELVIHLPMKRISPAYMDVTFETLHPGLIRKEEEKNDGDQSPFAALKHLNIQKN